MKGLDDGLPALLPITNGEDPKAVGGKALEARRGFEQAVGHVDARPVYPGGLKLGVGSGVI
jgi:hypothetical protein